jgi:hypothetical protein
LAVAILARPVQLAHRLAHKALPALQARPAPLDKLELVLALKARRGIGARTASLAQQA